MQGRPGHVEYRVIFLICRNSCKIECVCAGHVLGATSVVILAYVKEPNDPSPGPVNPGKRAVYTR